MYPDSRRLNSKRFAPRYNMIELPEDKGNFESRKRKKDNMAITRLPGDFEGAPCMAEGRKMAASDQRAGKKSCQATIGEISQMSKSG